MDINASVNWTKANVILNDQLGTALNGSHNFQRVNPAAELGLNGAWDKLTWQFNYSFVDAVYLTNATLSNAFGPEQVHPGDRIPSIPQNTVKLSGEYQVLEDWFVGADLQYFSSRYVRGDDANVYQQIGAFTTINLDTRYVVAKNVELFAIARNISNANYQNFGMLNTNFFTGQQERFLTPGAPITGYAGIRVHF